MLPIYDSWSLSISPFPPRSALYALEPIGIGTALVESLSGYVARLAEAHSISVGDLVGHVLSELADPQDPIVTAAAKAVRAGGHGFRACSYAINGVTDRATKWVHVLETATRRRDLRCLTLLPFRNAIPENLFHRHRAWCSFCFEQWRVNGQTIYEPLLWAFKVSSHCRVHQQPLSHSCHRCKRKLSPLGVFSRPGYCERCGCWLGASYVDEDRSKFISTDGEDQTWSSRQVEGLLAMLPRVQLNCRPRIASRKPDRVSRTYFQRQRSRAGRVHSVSAQHSTELAGWCDGSAAGEPTADRSLPECPRFEPLRSIGPNTHEHCCRKRCAGKHQKSQRVSIPACDPNSTSSSDGA